MEETLRHHLALCAAAFEAATGIKPSVVSRRAVQDSRYLERVIGGTGFTIATYDRLIAYFADHWPPETRWPPEVPHPGSPDPLPAEPDPAPKSPAPVAVEAA